MKQRFQVPIRIVGKVRWGDLSAIAPAYDICGESVKQKADLSFAGQHRVRLYTFKKCVHFKIPEEGTQLNIVDVPIGNEPPRRPQRR